jgi:dUTP pyrophosphatase
MNIKIQRITPTAKIPTRTHPSDTGYDLYADKVEYTDCPHQLTVYTGIAVQPEPGYYVEVYPRSSVGKKFIQLANSVGIIDETYTGQIILKFNMIPDSIDFGRNVLWYPPAASIKVGEKIAQMVVRKRIDADFIEVSYLDNTVRGEGGFGSTDKK